MFRWRHGLLGMVVLPYTLISLALPIIFLPMLYVALIRSAMDGGYLVIAIFAGVFTLGQAIICCFGLLITRSSLSHLLVVPLFRLISEPLRIYLLYRSFFAALRGRAHGWNKLPRTGTVAVAAGLAAAEATASTVAVAAGLAAAEGTAPAGSVLAVELATTATAAGALAAAAVTAAVAPEDASAPAPSGAWTAERAIPSAADGATAAQARPHVLQMRPDEPAGDLAHAQADAA